MNGTSIAELISKMTGNITSDKIKGIDTTIRLNLLGDQGGTWNLVIKDGECTVNQDSLVVPKLILESTAQDFMGIIKGSLDPVSAFMTGKLKFTGDLSSALKLAGILKAAG